MFGEYLHTRVLSSEIRLHSNAVQLPRGNWIATTSSPPVRLKNTTGSKEEDKGHTSISWIASLFSFVLRISSDCVRSNDRTLILIAHVRVAPRPKQIESFNQVSYARMQLSRCKPRRLASAESVPGRVRKAIKFHRSKNFFSPRKSMKSATGSSTALQPPCETGWFLVAIDSKAGRKQ